MTLKKRILLVDDDDDLRTVVQEFLEKNGYEVIAVAGGYQAMHIFDADPREPNLVLTDFEMPEGNGLTVAAYVKSKIIIDEKTTHKIPVIIMTGNLTALNESKDEIKADAVLFKPFHLEDLKKMIEIHTI